MGSAVVVPGRGFLLNNELTDFNALPTNETNGRPVVRGQGPCRPAAPPPWWPWRSPVARRVCREALRSKSGGGLRGPEGV